MSAFCDYGCTGTLWVGEADTGFPLNCPAWDLPNLTKLWFERSIRGDNVALPRAAGRRGFPRRLDEAEHNLPFHLTGSVNRLGVPYADPLQGLYNNFTDLWNNALAPVTTGNGTRACTLVLPNGDELTADVQFEPLTGDVVNARFVETTLRITIPAGRFA